MLIQDLKAEIDSLLALATAKGIHHGRLIYASLWAAHCELLRQDPSTKYIQNILKRVTHGA